MFLLWIVYSLEDPTTLKRMLKPMPSAESPVTSPEMGRRRYNYYGAPPPPPPHMHSHAMHAAHIINNNSMSRSSNQSALCNKRYAQAINIFDVNNWPIVWFFVCLDFQVLGHHTKLVAEVVTFRHNSNAVYIWNWNENEAV